MLLKYTKGNMGRMVLGSLALYDSSLARRPAVVDQYLPSLRQIQAGQIDNHLAAGSKTKCK